MGVEIWKSYIQPFSPSFRGSQRLVFDVCISMMNCSRSEEPVINEPVFMGEMLWISEYCYAYFSMRSADLENIVETRKHEFQAKV